MITANASTIIARATQELGLASPEVGFGSTDQVGIQSLALLNSLGEGLLREHDWQNLLKEATFTGTGSTDTFTLPADFFRVVNQTMWATTNREPVRGSMTAQQWGWLQHGIISDGILFRYRIADGKIQVFPEPPAGEQFTFYYISKNWVKAAASPTPNADALVNWSDVPQFPRALMIKGLKNLLWAAKGFDTTSLNKEYLDELNAYKGQSQGAQVIHLSRPAEGFLLDAWRNVPDGNW